MFGHFGKPLQLQQRATPTANWSHRFHARPEERAAYDAAAQRRTEYLIEQGGQWPERSLASYQEKLSVARAAGMEPIGQGGSFVVYPLERAYQQTPYRDSCLECYQIQHSRS
jgi:hypothetical protein